VYTNEKGYIPSSKVRREKGVAVTNGGVVTEEYEFSTMTIKPEGTTTVYDFQVEGNENFFVGGATNGDFFLVHNCFLKLLEEAHNTVFILCSMNPEKFKTTTLGKALANRCVQFSLEPHTNSDLLRQAKRICKGEGMTYMMDEDGKLLKKVVLNSNSEMRTLAQILEACQQYWNGLTEKPKLLSLSDVTGVMQSTEGQDDRVAYDLLLAVYSLQFAKAQQAILNTTDYVGMINRLMYVNSYLVNSTVVTEKHPKIWHTQGNKQLKGQLEKLKVSLGQLAEVNTRLVELKSKAMDFSVGCDSLLSAFAYSAIRKLQEMQK
jgi:DNA polymerase III gamma/tau subunit